MMIAPLTNIFHQSSATNDEHSSVWRMLISWYEYFRIQVVNDKHNKQQQIYQTNRHFNFVIQNFSIIDKVRFAFLFNRNKIKFDFRLHVKWNYNLIGAQNWLRQCHNESLWKSSTESAPQHLIPFKSNQHTSLYSFWNNVLKLLAFPFILNRISQQFNRKYLAKLLKRLFTCSQTFLQTHFDFVAFFLILLSQIFDMESVHLKKM